MHIPDGYLSPATCAASAALAAPAWVVAASRLKRTLRDHEAPLLAAGAAFAFVIMMLNVPIPGGTTAHAVGGSLVAVVLGPEAAIIAVTVTLVIQALFFGDGGVLALGANCLNMAVLLPVAGYAVYRALSGGRWSLPRPAAAACGAYVGINLAALAAAIELGVQPVLYHTAAGTPLYCPYRLGQTLPAMMLAHLTIAGGVEAGVTGLVIAYLARSSPEVLDRAGEGGALASHRWAWGGIALLMVLAPLGLLAPGGAFGEDSPEDLKQALGYVPAGLAHWADRWNHAPDYSLPGGEPRLQILGYWLSALAGVAAIGLLFWLLIRMLRSRPEKPGHSLTGPATDPATSPSDETVLHGMPAWLLQSEPGAALPQCNGRLLRRSFVEKTLTESSDLVRNTLFAETIARAPGLLQGLDPRVKLLTTAGFLLTACLVRDPLVLIALVAVSGIMAWLSRIPAGLFYGKLAVLPLFTALAATPALLNIVTPGDPLITLVHGGQPHWLGPFLLPPVVTITCQGATGVLILVFRVAASIAQIALLTLTTRWSDLLKALRAFLAPRLFILVVGMVYRYLFLFLETATDMFVARQSRTLGREDSIAGRRFVAITIGTVFQKSQALSEDVYAAMVSRGFRGEPRTLDTWHPGRQDALWVMACGLVIAVLWLGNAILIAR